MVHDSSFPRNLKIEETVNWIDKFDMDLTVFYFGEPVTIYFEAILFHLFNSINYNYDSAGHTYGPESTQYLDMVNLKNSMNKVHQWFVLLF